MLAYTIIMKPRTLAGTYSIFPIGLGAMPLSISGRPSLHYAMSVIEAFLELGGNFIDTADVYGLDDNDRGHNERLIHQAILKLSPSNNNIVIATKGGATRPQGGWSFRGGGHPEKLRNACEQSLKNLALTSHDLYYLHGIDPEVPLEDSLGELIRLKDEGKIKNIGIANADMVQLKTALKLTTIVAVQNRCNPFCKADFKNGLIEYCKLKNILYIPYCPLGGLADHSKLANSPFFSDLKTKYGISSYQISLAWLINKYDHIVPIPGLDLINQVATALGTVNIVLDSSDMQRIDEFPDFYLPVHIDPI